MTLQKLGNIAIQLLALSTLIAGAPSGVVSNVDVAPHEKSETRVSEIAHVEQNENWNDFKRLLLRPKRSLLKAVTFELEPAEGRHNNNRHYNYRSKPRRTRYNNHNQHSNNHRGKGGYHNSNSYNSNSGYSSNSNYKRAKKGDYGDSDHKKYGGQKGNRYGGEGHGGSEYGGRSGGSRGYNGSSGGHYEHSNGDHRGSGNHYGGYGGRGSGGNGGGGGGHHGEYGDDAESYLDGEYR